MRTRVKICGITRSEDALAAARMGADAIGLVFYEQSPRAINPEQARLIVADLPPFVTRVGLFVDVAKEVVVATLDKVALDVLQFHGEEPADYCRQFDRPYIKAIRMQGGQDIDGIAQQYTEASALLLDTFVAEQDGGGTGQVFDWDLVPNHIAKPVVLAGGLNRENVAEAIRRVHPYAVDVSSGVEQTPGIKDAEKMHAFIEEVNKL